MNLHQSWQVMRLSILFLAAGFLNASAEGFSQTITLRVQNAPLEKVFHEIEKQSGYGFLYEKALLQKARPVSLEVTNASVDQVLSICFANQPLGYSIIEKVVVIKERVEKRADVYNQPPVNEVKGRITNIGGEPLVNASILFRNGAGTQTDANGVFTIKNPTPDEIITISFTGYKPQTIRLNGRSNFSLVMEIATNELDEAIVQAYGVTTRRFATGNIAKVSAGEIEKQPVMNVLLALQGKVAGLDVKQINGFSSATIKVELRGRNSINGNFISDPLYIIDGVPLTVLDVTGNSTYVTGSRGFIQSGDIGPAGGQSPFFSINPNDIESMEILKDADATAIYGSRGANGVILITTKKGKAGKTKFDLNVQEGVTIVSRYWDMLNTQQYVAMRKEAFKNDNIDYTLPANAGQAYDLVIWDTTKYTDWQRALYGGTGKTIDVQASISGGDSHTSFRIGTAYNHTTNILAVTGADQRASASFNLSHASVNQKLHISFSNNYAFTQSDMVSLPGKVSYAPNAPGIYDSSGNLNWSGWGGNTNNSTARKAYPFAALKQPYTAKTNFLNSNLVIAYQAFKGLNLKTSFGYNNAQSTQMDLQPIASQDPSTSPTGTSSFGNTSNRNWIIEPQVTYEAVIGKGKLNVLAGGSAQHTNTDGYYVRGTGYTSDILLMSLASAPSKTVNDFHGQYRYAAIFGRITYNLQNKYILDLTTRRDGSSRFGEDKHFGYFGSVGAAWIFSEEGWVKRNFAFLSFGKLRGSYGTTGSDAVGDYGYLTRWSSTGTQPYNGISALAATQHANPDFHWPSNRKLEGAIDLGFLKDRINLSVAYYRNRCGDQLVSFPTPALSGFTSVVANSPALVQNDGLEFTASAKIISTKNIGWSVNFNTAINRNKLVSYPNFALSPYVGQLMVGEPLNMTRLYHFIGVDPLTGLYAFTDVNHDGQITRSSSGQPDDMFVKSLNPDFLGGFGMNFNYKSLELSVFFTYKKQIGTNAIFQGGYAGNLNVNEPVDVLDHWQKPGDAKAFARFTTSISGLPNGNGQNYKTYSDGAYTDASFIRLSNLSLSYSLPSGWSKKVGMQKCAIFLHTNNVLLITRYKGIDPETQNFGGLPPTRTIVGGINFNF